MFIDSGDGGKAIDVGGDGGILRNVRGAARILEMSSGNGGDAAGIVFNGGDGGSGGLIEKVNVSVGLFAQSIISGSGGNGSGLLSKGGDGGLISNVKIAGRGDIGNFENPFGGNNQEMGGLIVAKRGAGDTLGSRAASMVSPPHRGYLRRRLSTNANTLTSANAVTSIKNVTANVIGPTRTRMATSISPTGAAASLNQATAIDGLVIVDWRLRRRDRQ